MPQPWLPTDPRQAEIYRLLHLVGGEPAAYFSDACRLMSNEAGLQATTHVVAHLLRELDGALTGVLRPMVPRERWPDRGSKDSHRRKIDSICDALRVGPDDDLRVAWRDYASRLHRQAHRHGLAAPRPVDTGFRGFWVDGQTVTLRLARQIEANFTATLPLIERLATGAPDLPALRSQVPHSTVALDRFFEQAGVAWLGPLREAGYFDHPPPLAYHDDGSVGYERWPQGRYLARIAADAPNTVIEISLAIDTDNPEAHESLVDAALALDPAQAALVVPAVAGWLDAPAQWGLPFKVRELIIHLICGGAVEEGLATLNALLSSARIGSDRHLAGQLVHEMTPVIFPAAAIAGLELLCDRLKDEVAAESHGDHDYSYAWRPALGVARRRDLRDDLVSAVLDAAGAILADDERLLGIIVGLLEARDWSILRRIALDLVRRYPDAELVTERLADQDMFESIELDREYTALSREQFANLQRAAQETIFGWIEQGPPTVTEPDEDVRARWQLHMLNRLGSLSADWQARFDDLRARYGDPQEPHDEPHVGRWGPQTPLTTADLAAMTVPNLVAFLSSWEPAGGWDAPSPEGLGGALSQVVAGGPERFASGATTFLDLDPTYVRALLGGLREATRNGLTFPWREVLELCQATLNKPRDIEGRNPGQLPDLDPSWSWTWQESLRLIQEGLQDGDGSIPLEHRQLVWSVIERLSADPDPLADTIRDDDGMGPATRALNSTRGVAMHAAFQYGWWLNREHPEDQRRLPPELAELLELRLDVVVEPSDAIRSVYGQWFPHLVAFDAEFAARQVSAIFPSDTQLLYLWRAAWNTYVRSNRLWPSAFELLLEQYRRAIAELESTSPDDQSLGDVAEALVAHLMSLYCQGIVEFGGEDGLLDDFYARASVEQRAQALETIGHGLMDAGTPSEDGARRLRALWERRVQAVRESADPEAAVELRGYAWWFGSGHLEPDWSLAHLRMMLEAGGSVGADHLVPERLALLRSTHLLEVVRALELLVETATREWFVLGAREEITAILTDALAASGEPEARARDLTNRLVARGHRDFEQLLQR